MPHIDLSSHGASEVAALVTVSQQGYPVHHKTTWQPGDPKMWTAATASLLATPTAALAEVDTRDEWMK